MNSNDKSHFEILQALRSSVSHFLLVDTVGKPENNISSVGRNSVDEVNLVITDVARGLPRYLPFRPGRFYIVVTDEQKDLEMHLPPEIIFVLRKDLLFIIRYLVPKLEGYLNNRQVLMNLRVIPQTDSEASVSSDGLPLWQFNKPKVMIA